MSRSFVRTALTRPPTGLEKELKHLYFTKGRLRSVIDHARRLMDKGEAGTEAEGEEMAEMWNADAMGSLTLGAIISLKVSLGRWASCCSADIYSARSLLCRNSRRTMLQVRFILKSRVNCI